MITEKRQMRRFRKVTQFKENNTQLVTALFSGLGRHGYAGARVQSRGGVINAEQNLKRNTN
jgi:hypothetical protein